MKKFETAAALRVADTLHGPRLPGSVGARLAEESIADTLRMHGLTAVEREAGGVDGLGLMLVTLLLLVSGASLCLTAVAAFPTVPFGISLVAPLLLFLGAVVGWPVWEHIRGTAAKTPILIASIPGRPEPPARLMIVAGLLTPRGRVFGAGQRLAWLAAVSIGFVTLAPSVAAAIQTRPVASWGVIVVQWVALGVVVLLGPNRWTSRPRRGDNRTGLGIIVELARSWPKPLSDRVETVFVVAPGYRALPGRLEPFLGEVKPALVLILDAPGVGRELRIVGRGWARDMIAGAADNLWLPHRPGGRDERRFGLKAFRRAGVDAVAVCGRRDDSPIEVATIGGAAQLVAEVALRWARRAEAGQEEIRLKSSQNPG